MSKLKLPTPTTPTDEQTAAADTEAGLAALVHQQKEDFDRTVKQLRETVTAIQAAQGQLTDRYNDLAVKYTNLLEERQRLNQAWDAHHRESTDTVLKAGKDVRVLTERVQALETLRATQTDPHAVVRPLKQAIGTLQDEFNLLKESTKRALERLATAPGGAARERQAVQRDPTR